MIAMFGLSEVGGEVISRVWFASALPVSWSAALLLQWLLSRPRPALHVAIGGLVAQARSRPLVAAFYAIAAVVIETWMVAETLGRPLFR